MWWLDCLWFPLLDAAKLQGRQGNTLVRKEGLSFHVEMKHCLSTIPGVDFNVCIALWVSMYIIPCMVVWDSKACVLLLLFWGWTERINGLWQWHAKHEQGAAPGFCSTCHLFALRSTDTVVYAWSMHCMGWLVELVFTCQTSDFEKWGRTESLWHW